MINCVAFYDLCAGNGVQSYPTSMLFIDGAKNESYRGVKSLKFLTDAIEPVLERERPGSRPATLLLPEPLATARPKAADDSKLASVPKPDAQPQIELREPAKAGAAAAAPVPPAAPAIEELGSLKAEKPKAEAPAKVEPEKPAKPTKTPNPNGASVPLTAESFQTMVTMTHEPWFIKFYAPWCHHCQAMAPNWQQLAKEMKGKLNIGEVNCEAEKRLCKDARLRGYPTILFFRGGERVEYEGLRGIGDFVHYAEKAIDLSNGVRDVDADSLALMEEKEEVIFIYFYDHATTSEDFAALERLPLSLIGKAKLVKTQDPKLYERYKITTWPRLIISREGRPTYYNPLTPNENRNTRQVLEWMKSVWLPLIPELTASNAREIMDGKIVVLGILNREDQESFSSAIREMKSAATEWMDKQIQLFQLERQELRDAKQLRIEEAEDRGDQRALRAAKSQQVNMNRADRKEVAFAWVDGAFWQRWIRTTYGIDVKDGERVIINDEDVSLEEPLCRGLCTHTNLMLESPVLGPDQHGQLHRPVAHLDPGDRKQGHCPAAKAQAQADDIELRENLLRHACHFLRAPVPHSWLYLWSRPWLCIMVPRSSQEEKWPTLPERGLQSTSSRRFQHQR